MMFFLSGYLNLLLSTFSFPPLPFENESVILWFMGWFLIQCIINHFNHYLTLNLSQIQPIENPPNMLCLLSMLQQTIQKFFDTATQHITDLLFPCSDQDSSTSQKLQFFLGGNSPQKVKMPRQSGCLLLLMHHHYRLHQITEHDNRHFQSHSYL